MILDLLNLQDVAPPMGDLSANSAWSEPRALWTRPLAGEPADPILRIIHSRTVRLPGPAKLHRLGLRRTKGYHNCGSRQDPDWVTAVRLLVHDSNGWRELISLRELPPGNIGEVNWYAVPEITTDGVLMEIRGSGIDAGWVPWALAESACILEGELTLPIPPPCERLLDTRSIKLSNLPTGVSARQENGAVHYETNNYKVGFQLSRPGFSFLSLGGEDALLINQNTLFDGMGNFLQGPQLHVIGTYPTMAPSVRFDARGTVDVKGNQVTYDFISRHQHYRLTWTVAAAGLRLEAERSSQQDETAWVSSAWTLATRNSVTPAHAIGRITQQGEAGLLELPVAINLPRFGTLQFASNSDAVRLRFDAYRQKDYNTCEIKLGEIPLENGTYLLPAGTHRATVDIQPVAPPRLLRDDAPAAAHRALHRIYYTSLTYRPEMGTLSNNGASMPCAISMDTWTAFCFDFGEVLPRFPGHELIRLSLERWLDGGQSYADGRMLQDGKVHEAQDEYLMTGAAVLRGLADYLENTDSRPWFQSRLERIRTRLAAMQARDLDGDGLIESPWRTGVSGTGQWSTCWFDVTSFGWKDAFTNAILYPALTKLAGIFARHDLIEESVNLQSWAGRLKMNYRTTFFNAETGWLAGWRCQENKLHDYAFLMVNGCAITAGLLTAEEAREICQRLLAESVKVGLPKAIYGLPANLWPVPDYDLADIMQGFPFGYYQNGGRTHSQARHFVMALYQCGFNQEADRLLNEMCEGYAGALVYGGNKSGVDWRYWDDRPCGYEGLLTDQFGMIEAILHRYGRE
jgi:hypothetical protein